MRFIVMAIVFLLSVAQQAAAQQTRLDAFLESLKAKGFSVRQTFDGTKNEQNPANIAYVDPTYIVDLGIKLIDWQPFAGSVNHSVVISPIIEWHRANSPKKVN